MSKAKLQPVVGGRVLVTHNDLDGAGCAIIYSKCFPVAIIHSTDYADVNRLVDEIVNKIDEDTHIMISDMSISDNKLADKLDERGHVELIDHHPTAKWLDKYPWALVDTTKSATWLMYDVMSTRFQIEDLKPFVDLVNDYDTWGGGKGPSKEAIRLNRLLSIYGYSRFLTRFMDSCSIKLTDAESLMLELKEEEIQRYIRAAVHSASLATDAQGNIYAMISVDRYISESCSRVLSSFKEVEYVMAVDFINNKVSLRGRGNLDLGKMAKDVGGGGHRKSAGFPIAHGSQLRMILTCQGKCPVTDRLEEVIKSYGEVSS